MGIKCPFLGADVWTWNSSPSSPWLRTLVQRTFLKFFSTELFLKALCFIEEEKKGKEKPYECLISLPPLCVCQPSCWWVFRPSSRSWTPTLFPTGRNVAVWAQRHVALGQKWCQAVRVPSEHRQGMSCASVPPSCQLTGAEQGRERSGLEGSQWTEAFLNQDRWAGAGEGAPGRGRGGGAAPQHHVRCSWPLHWDTARLNYLLPVKGFNNFSEMSLQSVSTPFPGGSLWRRAIRASWLNWMSVTGHWVSHSYPSPELSNSC